MTKESVSEIEALKALLSEGADHLILARVSRGKRQIAVLRVDDEVGQLLAVREPVPGSQHLLCDRNRRQVPRNRLNRRRRLPMPTRHRHRHLGEARIDEEPFELSPLHGMFESGRYRFVTASSGEEATVEVELDAGLHPLRLDAWEAEGDAEGRSMIPNGDRSIFAKQGYA